MNKKSALASLAGLDDKQSEPLLPRNFIGSRGHGQGKVKAPTQLTPESSLDEIFVFARQLKASDIHLSAANPIVFRVNGALVNQTEENLSPQHIQKMVLGALNPELMERFKDTGDLETVYALDGHGRFRVTLMKQRYGWDLTARLVPTEINSFELSGMPEPCAGLTKWAQGLVLVTGPAGCGKTTTLSVLVEMINQERDDHIITIEDPIEVVFDNGKCEVTQREIGMHTLSQNNALKAALREDPDILVISELRDLESIQLAVSAAETGHLVFGTMNTNNAAQTISKLIDSFPPDEQSAIRNMISESLRGVISQQLIPKYDGSGLVAAYEVLLVNRAVSNLIREGKVGQIVNAITTGKSDGMVSLDNYLNQLVAEGVIKREDALVRASNPSLIQ